MASQLATAAATHATAAPGAPTDSQGAYTSVIPGFSLTKEHIYALLSLQPIAKGALLDFQTQVSFDLRVLCLDWSNKEGNFIFPSDS